MLLVVEKLMVEIGEINGVFSARSHRALTRHIGGSPAPSEEAIGRAWPGEKWDNTFLIFRVGS